MIANKRIAAAWRANLLKLCYVTSPEDIGKSPWVSDYLNLLDLGIDLFVAEHGVRTILMPELVLAELKVTRLSERLVSDRDHQSPQVMNYFEGVSGLPQSQIARVFKRFVGSDCDPYSIDSLGNDIIIRNHILDLPCMWLVLREAMTNQIEHSLIEPRHGK